jgi:hypothetical protein
MTVMTLPFPADPTFGSGALRRLIRLHRRAEDVVFATLDDTYHAMQCVLRHDGRRVVDIEATLTRIPTTACTGAANPIRELIGMPLDLGMAALYGDRRPQRNCTHLFDLAALALRQTLRDEDERRYDVLIPDETDTPVVIEVRRNDQRMHEWQVSQGLILAPSALAQRPMTAGFTPWALRSFAGDELEAALVLHKSYYIAQARRYRVDAFGGRSLLANAQLAGVCHAYTPERMAHTYFTGDNVRDFSNAVVEAVAVDMKAGN